MPRCRDSPYRSRGTGNVNGHAGGHDRREQLRGDPDRDRQREQQRVHDRLVQRHVDDEDGRRQRGTDLHPQHGESSEPDLEFGVQFGGCSARRRSSRTRYRRRLSPRLRARRRHARPGRSEHPDSSASAVPTGTGSVFLSAGRDSPVNTDSSHSRPVTSTRRTSAGTMSPSRSSMKSPGTSAGTFTVDDRPSRITTVW